LARLPAPRTVFTYACVTIAALVALHLATDSKIFDLYREANIPTWVSSAQFLLAGFVCIVCAVQDERAFRAWLVLAVPMTYFSLDEVAMIHERAEDHANIDLALLVFEPLIGLVLIAVVYSALRNVATKQVMMLLGGALVSLVLAQATSAIAEVADATGTAFDVLAILEEVFELLTGTFVLVAAMTQAGIGQSSKNA